MAADELLVFLQHWWMDRHDEPGPLLRDGEIRAEGRKALRQVIEHGVPDDRWKVKDVLQRAGVTGFSPDGNWLENDWVVLETFVSTNWPAEPSHEGQPESANLTF
ncbi:MAG: hypothetical protein WC764_00935 [Candidatus Paceibacterota bacterium]